MNVLSLFDGMSCGRIALERCGFKIDNYYASEIDKYAIQVAKANYPDTVHLGDVTQVSGCEIPDRIDLLIGGSPCQGFSFAGRQLNFDDPRSKLFFEYVRLLRELKPKYFILENVMMKQEYQDVITEHLGVQPIKINSNLVSAQNRKRLYWTNIPVSGLPEDKGIYLKDILEEGFTDREKAHCIDANYFKGGNLKSYFEKNRRQLIFDFTEESGSGLILAGEADLKGHGYNRRVYHPDGKAPSLCAASGGNLEPKILQVPRGKNRGGIKAKDGKTPTMSGSSWEHNNFVVVAGAFRGRYRVDGVRQDHKMLVSGLTQQELELREDGKTNTLTTVQKDNVAVHLEDLKWRKLTPRECERLQTVPDDYTSCVSNTQRYRMLGNGWTVDVICHLLEGMKDA
jgi:site-specific DNA-cytosine methylase